ncbi:hypothetical protein DFH05DRAFT_1495815 [Lentinula detonsa]|uniref:Uncharacterized protein n=1 Tax=Lentinula detonsa TaxID=2804962 RepID=A0A9W8NYE7_9AGAR|nr:hypothetical protein DFH05DRAFT_1495815 [Lentinula detonsa]
MAGSEMPMNIVHGTHAELILFLVLNMWPSHFGLPILLAIVLFSKHVQRYPTFVNLLVVFMVVGFSSSLLVYAGKASGPEPSRALCLTQASLLYGMPGMASVAVLTLLYQMLITIRAAVYKHTYRENEHAVRLWMMIIAPYAVWILFIIATVLVGIEDPANVSRDRRFFYCSVKSNPLTDTLTMFAAVVLFATFILEVWTIVLFCKRGNSGMFTTSELDLPLRILAFGIYILVAFSLSLLSMKAPESPIPDLIIASAATVVILIFGTQRDILRAICFWRQSHESSS